MPQVLGVWCEAEGHDVTFVCYTGLENLVDELPDRGRPRLHRRVHGGRASRLRAVEPFPLARRRHRARRPPRALLSGGRPKVFRLRRWASPTRPWSARSCGTARRTGRIGVHLAAMRQPTELPGVRERWKFIEPTLRKAPLFKIVPMLGSLGCPYTCSFCIDSVVPYQPLDFGVLRDDLRFLARTLRRPRVGWHDPNFGVRFDDYLDAIEDAVPPGRIDFAAESSLSLLSEPHLARLQRNGFKALLPGVESWYELGNKSKTGQLQGMDKVRQVSEHVNTDPPLRPLRADQLRPRARLGRRRGAVRADEALRRPDARARSPAIRCSRRSAGPRRSTSNTSGRTACCRSRSTSSTTTTR